MRIITALALATATVIAAPAFAQDNTDTASGKRFAVVGGIAHLQPKGDAGAGIGDIDGDPAPTLSASWYLNDNFAVELWGAADKFNHRVNSDTGAKLGTVEQQPLALSAQYHFGRADSTFRPFVGVGYYESNFSNEDIPALDGLHVGVETAKGAIGTVGVDMNINPTWFVRADARYLHARPELTVGGQGSGSDLKLDPWVVGLGIGARF